MYLKAVFIFFQKSPLILFLRCLSGGHTFFRKKVWKKTVTKNETS
jgi:hypothetical protein